MGETSIEWTDKTWNPTRGCSRISPGCENCYAERIAGRFAGSGLPYEGLARKTKQGYRWTGEMRLVADKLREPLSWHKPRRVFVNSMSDLFHENLTDQQIMAVFGVMAAAPQHTFQVLTKRAERMHDWFAQLQTDADGPGHAHLGHRMLAIVSEAAAVLRRNEGDHERAYDMLADRCPGQWPLPNVWLGTSAENQEYADARIPWLLNTPAVVRFVSYEPALGPVNFRAIRQNRLVPGLDTDALTGAWSVPRNANGHYTQEPRVRWVIAGAESGPGARPAQTEWFTSVRDQCKAAGVAFFCKQFATPKGKKISLPMLDGVQHAAFPEVAR